MATRKEHTPATQAAEKSVEGYFADDARFSKQNDVQREKAAHDVIQEDERAQEQVRELADRSVSLKTQIREAINHGADTDQLQKELDQVERELEFAREQRERETAMVLSGEAGSGPHTEISRLTDEQHEGAARVWWKRENATMISALIDGTKDEYKDPEFALSVIEQKLEILPSDEDKALLREGIMQQIAEHNTKDQKVLGAEYEQMRTLQDQLNGESGSAEFGSETKAPFGSDVISLQESNKEQVTAIYQEAITQFRKLSAALKAFGDADRIDVPKRKPRFWEKKSDAHERRNGKIKQAVNLYREVTGVALRSDQLTDQKLSHSFAATHMRQARADVKRWGEAIKAVADHWDQVEAFRHGKVDKFATGRSFEHRQQLLPALETAWAAE